MLNEATELKIKNFAEEVKLEIILNIELQGFGSNPEAVSFFLDNDFDDMFMELMLEKYGK